MDDEIPKVRGAALALRILLVALPGLLLVAAAAAWAAGLLPARLVGGSSGCEAARPAERAHTLL
ncbi:MAG TPA: hypothetical protein VHQ65_13760, partial [Thermoanaerobaculia bacterium]|nr:hypothetical protein [Thermoanaerobaculia bacterium]